MTHTILPSASSTSILDTPVPGDAALGELHAPAGGDELRHAVVAGDLAPADGAPEGAADPTRARPKIREATVRSILFRRRLAEALVALELAVLEELRQTGREACRVGDYVVRDTPTGLAITEAPASDARQLELPLLVPTPQKP